MGSDARHLSGLRNPPAETRTRRRGPWLRKARNHTEGLATQLKAETVPCYHFPLMQIRRETAALPHFRHSTPRLSPVSGLHAVSSPAVVLSARVFALGAELAPRRNSEPGRAPGLSRCPARSGRAGGGRGAPCLPCCPQASQTAGPGERTCELGPRRKEGQRGDGGGGAAASGPAVDLGGDPGPGSPRPGGQNPRMDVPEARV